MGHPAAGLTGGGQVVTTRFSRGRGGRVTLSVHADEAPVLAGLLGQLASMVAPEDDPDEDPLAAMVGIGTATETPDDPVLARLFPDAYAEDPAAAGEFRRYTERTLRQRKLDDATLAAATLDPPGAKRTLSDEEALAWLGALNDMRLALGTRLEVTEDLEAQVAVLGEDDPRRPLFVLYEWLGWLQSQLVDCLASGPGRRKPERG